MPLYRLVPLRERVKSSLGGEVLADSGYFDMASIAELVDQHHAGLRDHSAVIWALVMFESFLRQVHIDDRSQIERR